MKDDIEAPWVGNADYGEQDTVSHEDYDFYWQDDVRKDEEIRAAMELENK